MLRVLVRSRAGNLALAVVGAVYALSSLAVLTWFAVDVWHAAAMLDYVIELALLISAACGLWFVRAALRNLGLGRQAGPDTSNPASIHR
jgi:hypothetical protein